MQKHFGQIVNADAPCGVILAVHGAHAGEISQDHADWTSVSMPPAEGRTYTPQELPVSAPSPPEISSD